MRKLEDNLDWDILYLGLNKAKYQPVSELVFINRVISRLCTHAYIVNCKSLHKIIKILENSEKQIDLEYQDCMTNQKLKCYFIPNQFKQNNSFSNINQNFNINKKNLKFPKEMIMGKQLNVF